ncbi:KamA family radical SAM protein [Desulfobacula toluolica]|uniref:Lysine 2,3-aminomutase related protein n=1 Tax=Desulfobacula toluolica (strain DSM 7467 / Tol2) TaxID=651182 RepID=K0N6W1_DESTT|nr:lysine 2,3-aminomutase [Desulfobacula toluolica]CCK79734.1 lysine 2,3-aminomutase related protein [Desulfobacula toluolica Tol2]
MKYQSYTLKNLHQIKLLNDLPDEIVDSIKVVGQVLPFKSNNYVLEELINWNNFEKDPLFTLTFPRKEMLKPNDYKIVKQCLNQKELATAVSLIRAGLNPHPAEQMEKNVPIFNGIPLNGIQHKYRETMLAFPSKGQLCHAFCSFCFRWPQFSGIKEKKFALKNADLMIGYLKEHPEITDVLFTGGDPMIMHAKAFEIFIDAIIKSGIKTVKTIRIGSKTLSFWPYRYLTDSDSDELLDLFKKVTDAGFHLSFMAHICHENEMSTDAFKEAVKAIRDTGTIIRTQSPVMQHINDNSENWSNMWRKQVSLGMIPYYMFVARNTGSHRYFSIPILKAYDIFRKAYMKVSGVARTVRGPIMSASPGKIGIDGIVDTDKGKVISLSFIQGRNPEWVKRPFFAKYDEKAVWLDDLKPAFGKSNFFFNEHDVLLKN